MSNKGQAQEAGIRICMCCAGFVSWSVLQKYSCGTICEFEGWGWGVAPATAKRNSHAMPRCLLCKCRRGSRFTKKMSVKK
jgi:hypothetical protein